MRITFLGLVCGAALVCSIGCSGQLYLDAAKVLAAAEGGGGDARTVVGGGGDPWINLADGGRRLSDGWVEQDDGAIVPGDGWTQLDDGGLVRNDGAGRGDGRAMGGDGDSGSISGDAGGGGDPGLCNGVLCGPNEECVDGSYCDTICHNDRCGPGASCCADTAPVCVYNRYCQAACPNATDVRCGSVGQLCCDTSLDLTCGVSGTCVKNCAAGHALCGDGSDNSYGTTCCAPGQVCVFNACVTPHNVCSSFLDCQNGDYCELALDPPRCMPNDYPAGVPECQGGATDVFAPEINWHFLGVINQGGSWQLCENAVDYGTNCYKNVETAPMVADLDKVTSTSDLVFQSRWASQPTTFPAGQTYPEVVFKAYRTGYFDDNVLVILDGRDGSLKKVIPGESRGQIALGNLDSDPQLEIVAAHNPGITAYDPFYQAPASGGTMCPTLDANGACEVNWSDPSVVNSNGNGDFNLGAPAITDLNGDGQAEVVIGSYVLDGRDGSFLIDPSTHCANPDGSAGGPTLLSLTGGGTTGEGDISTIADVNLDGVPDIIAGNHAITVRESGGVWSCQLDWTSPDIGNGFVAVGNFVDNTKPPYSTLNDPNLPADKDYPEVAVVSNGSIAILNGASGHVMPSPVDGTTPLKFSIFTQKGGPPNIADFDGDGHVEVSFAGPDCMVVVDPDCAVADAATRQALATTPGSGCAVDPTTYSTANHNLCTSAVQAGIGDMLGILWMHPTQDVSSAATGTTVFDFQGDGKAEVLYNDECFFRVFNGETGSVVMERPNSHRTGTEYPIVADVDGDSNSEIVVASTGDMATNALGATFRDKCANTDLNPATTADAYNSGQEKNTGPLTLYKPSFCSCGNHSAQADCDAAPGCIWDATAGSCGVYDCSQWTNATDCGAVSRRCQWNGTSCVPYPDTQHQVCINATWGVTAIGDAYNLWVKTRPIWNEHTYHVTNTDLAGQPQTDWGPGNNNWDIYNNFRQNVQGFAPLNAPDLQIYSFTVSFANCPAISLDARIVNRGRAGVAAGVPVVFYRTDTSTPTVIDTVPLPYALLPGQGADVSTTYNAAVEPPSGFDFYVVVNPPDGVNPPTECNTSNNDQSLFNISCTVGG